MTHMVRNERHSPERGLMGDLKLVVQVGSRTGHSRHSSRCSSEKAVSRCLRIADERVCSCGYYRKGHMTLIWLSATKPQPYLLGSSF